MLDRAPKKNSPLAKEPRCVYLIMALVGGILCSCTDLAGYDDGYWLRDSPSQTEGEGNGSVGQNEPCAPFSEMECYGGPPGTKDIGICRPGLKVCNAQGTGFGPCQNEILPKAEQCSTGEDDDCDGSILDPEAGCLCIPGEAVECYSGPPSTRDIGVCKAGQATCNPDGKTKGVCFGEVKPVADDCSGKDGNCDGLLTLCESSAEWLLGFGTSAEASVHGVAVDGKGASFLVGHYGDSIDFGDSSNELACTGFDNIFIAKVDGAGNTEWSRQFGDEAWQYGHALAADKNGNILVTGVFAGAVNFGGETHIGDGGDIFLTRFDSDGNFEWSKQFGGQSDQSGRAVAIDANGEIVLTGGVLGSVDFGCGATSNIGSEDVFISKFLPDGSCVFSKRAGSSALQMGTSIAVDSQNNIFVAGHFRGILDFGCGSMLSGTAMDGYDAFLAKLDPNGACLWSKRFGDGADQYGTAVAVGSADQVILVGYTSGIVDFGSGPAQNYGGNDLFVAAFDNMGALLWNHVLGGAGDDFANAVATKKIGNSEHIAVVGEFSGSIDLGGGIVSSAGGQDIYVLNLAGDGKYISSQRFGDDAAQTARGVSIDLNGNLILTGRFGGVLDIGMHSIVSVGAADIFLAKIKP